MGDELCATVVAWDTETTGLGSQAQIVSIGWCVEGETHGGEEVFVIPTCPIDPGAFAVHGLDEAELVRRGATGIAGALRRFFVAIEAIKSPVLLIAHNGRGFDTHRLRYAMVQADITELPPNVVGFADTLLWARANRSTLGCTSCSLDALCTVAGIDLSRRIDRHGARVDAEILMELYAWLKGMCDDDTSACSIEGVPAFFERTQRRACVV
jgi:DNA polymerase-3 subunit epsilon